MRGHMNSGATTDQSDRGTFFPSHSARRISPRGARADELTSLKSRSPKNGSGRSLVIRSQRDGSEIDTPSHRFDACAHEHRRESKSIDAMARTRSACRSARMQIGANGELARDEKTVTVRGMRKLTAILLLLVASAPLLPSCVGWSCADCQGPPACAASCPEGQEFDGCFCIVPVPDAAPG